MDIAAKRFHLDPRSIAWLHADAVIALISLTIGLYLLLKTSETQRSREVALHNLGIFLAVALGQGAIGYTQYFTKLPEILVGAHLLGASLIAATMWKFVYATELLSIKNNVVKNNRK